MDAADKTTAVLEVATVAGFKSSLADAASKVVVVRFWASWVKPCEPDEAAFVAASLEYEASAVFISVNADAGGEVLEFCGVRGMPCFQLFLESEREEEVIGGQWDVVVGALRRMLGLPVGDTESGDE